MMSLLLADERGFSVPHFQPTRFYQALCDGDPLPLQERRRGMGFTFHDPLADEWKTCRVKRRRVAADAASAAVAEPTSPLSDWDMQAPSSGMPGSPSHVQTPSADDGGEPSLVA